MFLDDYVYKLGRYAESTRICVGNITFHRRGPMSSQPVSSLSRCLYTLISLGDPASHLIEMIMA